MGSGVFQGSNSLKRVIWNAPQISQIPSNTFQGCLNLEEVIFSKEAQQNITSISDYAFQPSSSSYGKLKLNLNAFKNLSRIGQNAFYRSELTLINDEGEVEAKWIVPKTLINLENWSLAATKIEEVFFHKDFKSFGEHSFDRGSLKKIELENGMSDVEIADAAFLYCPLEEIVNSDCIKTIGNSSLYGTKLTITNEFKNVEEIGYQSFGYTDSLELSLPKLKYYEHVSKTAQPFCASDIQTLTFGTDLGKEISENYGYYNEITPTFFSRSQINTIKFLGTIEQWCDRIITSTDKDWPFAKTITYEDGTTSGGRLFVYNKNNELVEFKGTSASPFEIDVETIRANAFANYKNFGCVKFSNNLKHIKENAFKDISVASGEELYFNMYPYQYLELTFENEFSSPYSLGMGTGVVRCNNVMGTNKVSITNVADNVFQKKNETTQELELQKNVVIPAYAFAYAPATNINMGQSYYFTDEPMQSLTIEKGAFLGVQRCTTVKFNNTQRVVVGDQAFYNAAFPASLGAKTNELSIGEEAFYNCSKLARTGTSSEGFVLSKIKTIGDRAFYGCTSLITVTLGSENNPVEFIGADAFAQCTGITKATIYYDNSLYTEDTFNTMPNYPWGLNDAVTIEGIGTTKITSEV